MKTPKPDSPPAFKFGSSKEAYSAAKRRIINNALRRRQSSLDLSNFGLMELPPEIGQLRSLRKLDVSHNQLATLPSEIGDLAALTELDASANKLGEIPKNIGNLRNLQRLDLAKNKLQRLPSSIGTLGKLEYLLVDENTLEELPTEIGDLKELYMLGADGNQLSSLPRHMVNLKQINALFLNGNRFPQFPPEILELSTLTILMLADNSIAEIPSSISRLKNLRDLFMPNNALKSLPREIAALKLLGLGLAQNRLTGLPTELGNVTTLLLGARGNPRNGLSIEGNELPEPYDALIAPGQPKATENVLAWLRGELDPAGLEAPAKSDHELPAPPTEPSEEAGPTFSVHKGQIDLVPSPESDSSYDREIQDSLHRRLRRQSALLLEATVRVGNQHPQLLAVISEYASLITPDIRALDVIDLWAAGNAVMAQAFSFQQQDSSRTLSEPLEPAHLGLLTEVAALHGSFILGFPTAVDLTRRADEARVTPEVLRTVGPATSTVLSALSRQHRLLSERARRLIDSLDAALLSGSWEVARIGYTSYATVRNALVTIGKLSIWINDKGGSLVGGALVTSAVAASNLPPETLQLTALFLTTNASDILSFAAPFPELRVYLEWIVNYFDALKKPPRDLHKGSNE